MIGRRPVPEAVAALRTVERREAWGLTPEGTPLVATASALHVGSAGPASTGTASTELAWIQIERVSWVPPRLVLTEVSEVEGQGAVRAFELAQDSHLAEVVRTRVTSSIGWSDRRALVPTGAVRLVGRRSPGRDILDWQLVFEPGTDPHDPLLREQAEEHVRSLRRTIG